MEVKQRIKKNKRRERAERMHQAQRDYGDSAEDETLSGVKPPRPPIRRKKFKEISISEEDIIDGFAFISFNTFEDADIKNELKLTVKNSKLCNNLVEDKKSRVIRRRSPAPNHDAGTSDDNGRAFEVKQTGLTNNNAHRDNSHDRLSDGSSRCSSGKGYICDSEGEDDKGSDVGSLFTTTPNSTPRKHDLPQPAHLQNGLGSPPPRPNNSAVPKPHFTLPLDKRLVDGKTNNHSRLESVHLHPPVVPSHRTLENAPGQIDKRLENSVHTPTSLDKRLDAHAPGLLDKGRMERDVSMAHAPVSNLPHGPAIPNPGQPGSQHSHSPALPNNHHQPAVHPSSNSLPSKVPGLTNHNYPPPRAHPHPHPHPHPVYMGIPTSQKKPHVIHNPGLPSSPRPPTPVISTPATTHGLSSPHHPHPTPSSIAPHPGLPSSHSTTPTSTSQVTTTTSGISPHPGLPTITTTTTTTTTTSSSLLHHSTGGILNHSGASNYSPYPSYPPLYAPYSSTLQHSPYLPQRIEQQPPLTGINSPTIGKAPSATNGPVATTTATITTGTTTSHRDIVTTPVVGRSHSPRGHSPNRERDSYSSNVSSLSRSSVTPVNAVPTATPSSSTTSNTSSSLTHTSTSSFTKTPAWAATNSPARHPSSFPPPMFPPPGAPQPPAPFSAESLFQSNQADLLRRELDTRFLASQERSLGVTPAYLRTEMHHHQHQHTHVHQHQGPTLFPPPLFKDIPKIGGIDSPFYRGNLGLTNYPGFSPGLGMGPGLPATPFAPPSHLTTFTPKQVADPSKPRIVKTGKWNAMHVRVAWEIYHHQQKQAAENKTNLGTPAKDSLLRPSGHLFPPPPPGQRELAGYPPGFLPPPSHLSSGVSPFSRYPPLGGIGAPTSSFPGLPGFPHRELPPLGPLGPVHDPWRLRGPGAYPVGPSPWGLKQEPNPLERRELEEREREREREKERIRREREERERDRERREREEKRKLEAERERERREKERREIERRDLERINKLRDRSPLRNGEIKEEPRPAVKDEEVVMLGRTGPGATGYPPHPYSLGRHPGLRPPLVPPFAPPGWPPPPGPGDPYGYRLDQLQLRYNPLMSYRSEEEAKLYSVGSYLPPPPHHTATAQALLKKEENPR